MSDETNSGLDRTISTFSRIESDLEFADAILQGTLTPSGLSEVRAIIERSRASAQGAIADLPSADLSPPDIDRLIATTRERRTADVLFQIEQGQASASIRGEGIITLEQAEVITLMHIRDILRERLARDGSP